jgi:hypothetical protein
METNGRSLHQEEMETFQGEAGLMETELPPSCHMKTTWEKKTEKLIRPEEEGMDAHRAALTGQASHQHKGAGEVLETKIQWHPEEPGLEEETPRNDYPLHHVLRDPKPLLHLK